MAWIEASDLYTGSTMFMADTAELKAAAVGAFSLLSMRILRHGPVPHDDIILAGIARVGRKTWQNRIKPAIAHLVQIKDGLIYLMAERSYGAEPAAQKPAPDPVLSETRRRASFARWGQRTGVLHPGDANADAKLDANHANADAKPDAKSMAGAETLHVGLHDAHAGARLSLSGTANEVESSETAEEREREAGAREPDANLDPGAHAKRDASGRLSEAEKAAESKEEKRPPYYPLPDDWVPNEAAHAEARARSCDVFEVARKFRNWAHANQKRAKDWDYRFLNFLIDERASPDRSQGSMPQVIRGGGGAGAADRERAEYLAKRMREAREDATGTWDG